MLTGKYFKTISSKDTEHCNSRTEDKWQNVINKLEQIKLNVTNYYSTLHIKKVEVSNSYYCVMIIWTLI